MFNQCINRARFDYVTWDQDKWTDKQEEKWIPNHLQYIKVTVIDQMTGGASSIHQNMDKNICVVKEGKCACFVSAFLLYKIIKLLY